MRSSGLVQFSTYKFSRGDGRFLSFPLSRKLLEPFKKRNVMGRFICINRGRESKVEEGKAFRNALQ